MTVSKAAILPTDEDDNESRALEILSRLPRSAQDRFEQFRRWHVRRASYLSGLVESRLAAHARRTAAEARLGQHDRAMSRYDLKERDEETGKWKEAVDPERDRLAAEVARAKAEIARLKEEGDLPRPITEGEVYDFLFALGSRRVTEAAVPLKDKRDLHEQIRSNRTNKDSLVRERKIVERSARTKDEMKAKANAQIAALIERGAPKVSFLRKNGDIIWPRVPILGLIGDGGDQQFAFDAPALFAWLNADQLQEKVFALIDAQSDDGDVMSAEEMRERLSEIDAAMLQLDREAEELFRLSDRERVDNLGWRRDTNPLAILGLA